MSDTEPIPLFALNFDEREPNAAAEAIRSGWISTGPRTIEFERRFAEHLNATHAVAVNSCTAALHIALALLVKPGDEVIVPSLTFVATVNAIRYVGATPVFADVVGLEDFSLDPADVERKITDKTRAVLPMHFGGFACPLDELLAICETHNLSLIEDAAHAPDSRYNERALGTFGQAGCFSFFSNKNMTCAEGGMVVFQDEELAERARRMRSHGMTTLSYERATGHATRYDVLEIGYNYRLDDIRAAIALVQLEKLPPDIRQREQVRQWYVDRLTRDPRLTVPYLEYAHRASHYIMPVVINEGGEERRDAVRKILADNSIQTSVHYPAVHRFESYRSPELRLPKTEQIVDHEITLPMFAALTCSQVDRVCETLLDALDQTS